MSNLIIKLLAAIGFKKAINNYVYSFQSNSYRQYLEFAFVDSNGQRYFKFNDLKNMPLSMLEQLNILQMEADARIKGTDLDQWTLRCKELISKGNPKTAVADFAAMLSALELRRQVSLDPELLMEICALLYIREDENPAVYNKDLHRQKFEQFNKDKQGGLYDFFQSAGLNRYIPSESFTPQEWPIFLKSQIKQINRFSELLSEIGYTSTT